MAFPDFGSPSPTQPNQGKVPQGGLGAMLQRILAGAGKPGGAAPQGGPAAGPPPPPPGAPGMPPQAPAPMIPGMPPMPGPGGPLQGASISPEEHQAMLEQVKAELMKQIAGQSGQQDRIFEASRGLASYRPIGNPVYPQTFQQAPGAPPYVPPGSVPPGVPAPPPTPVHTVPPTPRPIPVPNTNYGPYTRG